MKVVIARSMPMNIIWKKVQETSNGNHLELKAALQIQKT
jgi:hypothetical protein